MQPVDISSITHVHTRPSINFKGNTRQCINQQTLSKARMNEQAAHKKGFCTTHTFQYLFNNRAVDCDRLTHFLNDATWSYLNGNDQYYIAQGLKKICPNNNCSRNFRQQMQLGTLTKQKASLAKSFFCLVNVNARKIYGNNQHVERKCQVHKFFQRQRLSLAKPMPLRYGV